MATGLLYRGPALDVLHEDYAKRGRVDELAPVAAARSIRVEAPPDRVWRVLAAVAAWPSVDPAITRVELPGGVAVDAPFTWSNGRSRIRSRFAVVDPGRELTWTGVSGGARAVHRHVLRPGTGGATELASTESMAGPLLTLLYGSAELDQGMLAWLEAVKSAAEGGTEPTAEQR